MNIKPAVMANILLAAARQSEDAGAYEVAIELLEQALHKLEAAAGAKSMLLAPVLSELSDCYEVTGRRLKARQYRFRLRAILTGGARAS